MSQPSPIPARCARPRRLAPTASAFSLAAPLLFFGAVPAWSQAVAGEDPFAAGLRWKHVAPAVEPWIPRDVVFAAGGELVFAAPAVANPMLQVYASADLAAGTPGPLFEDRSLAGALGQVGVAAGDTADELFSIAQYGAPTASTRRSTVARHDAFASAAGGSFAAVWTRDFDVLVNGPARVACAADGSVLVAAVFDSASGEVLVDRLDPSTGAPTHQVRLTATSLRNLVVSRDGTRVAVAAGSYAYALDVQLNELLARVDATTTEAIALSSGGAWFACARFAAVDVYYDTGGGYALESTFAGGANEIPTAVVLSDDGSTLAVAWWDAVDGVGIRCEVYDRSTLSLLNSYAQTTSPFGLQNYPVEIAMTADGRRVAIGLWGVGDSNPEIVLLERGVSAPILTADAPGSTYALDLSSDGTRVAFAGKNAHANLFSTTGEVALFDTGERDLQMTRAARIGGSLELAFQMSAPGLAVFALGFARTSPVAGRFGELWVDFTQPHFFVTVPSVGLRADLALVIAPDPSLAGLAFAVQALGLGPAGPELAATAVFPTVL